MGKMDYTKMDLKKYPWVFWITIQLRTDWFKRLWYTRGANNIEIQFIIWCITIGLPWVPHVLKGKIRDYGNLDTAMEINTSCIIYKYSFPIGSYTKFYASEKQSQ